MGRFRVSVLLAIACLCFTARVNGQVQKSYGVRAGGAATTVASSVEGGSPASSSGVAAGQPAVVPRMMKFSGALRDAAGKPLTGTVDVTFSLYSTEAGGDALWYETQSVQADELGRYTALLGAMHADGLPMELFTSGEVRWLGIQVGSQAEQQPRVLLVSVPYALKAGDAETLGGKPASAYMLSGTPKGTTSTTSVLLAPTSATQTSTSGTNQQTRTASASAPLTACTSLTSDGTAPPNTVSYFTSACNIQGSDITLYNGNLGFGIATPMARLHIFGPTKTDSDARFNVILGDSTSAAAGTGGGILFSGYYNGTTNRAGFANVRGVKENSIQGDYASAMIFDTRVNGGNQTERMRITSAGFLGIGTSTPVAMLEVSGTAKFDGAVTMPAGVAGNLQISGLGNALIFPDGTVQTTAGTGAGGGTITGVTAGTDLTGGGTAGGVTLNLDVTKVPQLASPNTFIGDQTIAGSITTTGTISGNGAGLTGIPNSALSGSARNRGIVYLAGCDSCAPLEATDSQAIFYVNAVGAMTITSVSCYADAGSPQINIARHNGGPTNLLSSSLTCNGTPTASFTSTSLALNDELDFVLATPDGVAKRVTVVIQTSLN